MGFDRVAKSAEVKRAGGVGMVLANLTENSLDADSHTVPTVHVNPPASTAIKSYAATSGATARLIRGNSTTTSIPYPQIAGFSSRGPSLSSNGATCSSLIWPPRASRSSPRWHHRRNSGRDFDFYSGTSMASPHVAGLAAIFLGVGVHPNWSPMRIKSALMTTAGNTKTATGGVNTDPYAQGAGEVQPRQMLNPALVYPAGDRDWLAYLEGLGIDTGTGVRGHRPERLQRPVDRDR